MESSAAVAGIKKNKKSWCYHNKIENGEVAGRLYTWAAAIDSVSLAEDSENPITCGTSVECTLPETVQGICPEGWHLPSSEEWTILETFVGGNTEAGTYLKSKAGWKKYVDVSNLDSFGFSAFPAGQIHLTLSLNFDNGLYTTSWWTATENSSIYANPRYMTFSKNYIGSVNLSKIVGYSVRCIKN
ncbi:MAG TPA: FISUMP domain-containing protein [Fibrobacteraceae bacterium]|nr:FISUMP domain-containing protein [Fibrobacteraceae bacterium]